MTMSERRFDRDGKLLTGEEPEERESLSSMLERRRADALAKEEAEKRADQVADIKERLTRPIEAQDLQRKLGGETTGAIDRFFSDDDGDLN
jgi:hypothetical protein